MSETELYRIRKFVIRKDDDLYSYCDNVTALANNFANAVRFRQRQVLTAVKKDTSAWTPNEKEIMDEIKSFTDSSNGEFEYPTDKKHQLSYKFLNGLMVYTSNPDYLASGFPRQSAQQMIKICVAEMKSFFQAIKSYQKNPASFTGKPELPGYRRKGGHTSCKITNQDAVLRNKDGSWSLKLPLTKIHLNAGPVLDEYTLKETEIIPDNGVYVISLTFQKAVDVKEPSVPSRIASCDIGVDNLLSVTNNAGLPFIIYKGTIIKSVNRLYNKKMAEIMSAQTTGTTKKFVPTQESQAVTLKRNFAISDFMHKVAKHLISWCVENRIDTVLVGVNKGFKQNVEIGHVNNQNFVQIPFGELRWILKYLCEENGINYIEREESYTSKANFLNRDFIPTYGKDDKDASFTGRRKPTRYKSSYIKKNGFRGLYKTNDGIILNSDLNGSANILRKEFPDLCGNIVKENFENVTIIKHPDYDKTKDLYKQQTSSHKTISRSKQKRLKRKSLVSSLI